MKQTTVYLKEGTMATLRELAKRQGLTVSRGPGAGNLGNVSALLDKIAEEANVKKDLYDMAERVTKIVNRDAARYHAEFTESQVYDVIAGDWPNATDHENWLFNEASDEQIADWVYGILINTID